MKKADTPIVLAAALVAILQATPAAAEFRTRTVDYKHGDTALEGYLAYDDCDLRQTAWAAAAAPI